MPTAPQAPNLLLIWTDEQRWDTMSCYGNDHVHTPNLDRLAADSYVFDNATCVQPVCTPSRGCILSGLMPWDHGAARNNIPLNADTKTIAELVDPAYRRAYYGKWHLGDELRAQHGFDDWRSVEDGIYRSFYSTPDQLEWRSDYHHFLIRHGFTPDETSKDGARLFSRNLAASLPYRFTKCGYLAEEVAAFLRGRSSDQPFLMSTNFFEPHMPFVGPFNDMYDPDALPVGPAFCEPPADNVPVRNHVLHQRFSANGFQHIALDPEHMDAGYRRIRANYLGLVTMVDRAVGTILDTLEASGLADNTIVVFTSDHGEMLGDHAMLTKGVAYEESVHIPLLIRVPWLNARQRHITGRISQIDLMPTLLDLMNQPIPDGLAGTSRLDVLTGDADLDDNDVVVMWGAENKAFSDVADLDTTSDLDLVNDQCWRSLIAADNYKLTLYRDDRHQELYNLNADPHELTNLIDDPAQADRIATMTARLKTWQENVRDPFKL